MALGSGGDLAESRSFWRFLCVFSVLLTLHGVRRLPSLPARRSSSGLRNLFSRSIGIR
jgi:hypothetical protein